MKNVCVSVAIALLTAGCTTDCDEANDKLESCGDQIYHTFGTTTRPTPVAIDDDCSGQSRCLADCVNAASCDALAFVLNEVRDPNIPVPAGALEFSQCFTRCTGWRP